MTGEKINKKELKKYIKKIDKLKYDGHNKEEFKQVIYFKKGYSIEDGIYLPYLVSSYGRVFSLNYHMQRGRVEEIIPSKNSQGYLHLILYNKGKKYNARVNRLVAIAFKKNKNYLKYNEVNHIETNLSNNCKWNLKWVTGKENVNYSFKINSRKIQYGEKANSSKYKEKEIRKICEFIQEGYSLSEISNMTEVPYDTIANILYKRQWTTVSDDYDFSKTSYWKNKL